MKHLLTFKRLVALQIVVVGLILYFGLWPKGLTIDNRVQWLEDRAGIRIDEYGMAYSDIAPIVPAIEAAGEFTIEFAVRAETDAGARFKSLLMVHNGSDQDQLIVGQWKAALIVMNGDDYDHSRRTKRLIFRNALRAGDLRLISVVSRPGSTELYVDGRLAVRHLHLQLHFPKGNERIYLVLGNSVYGTNTWDGEVCGFGIYPRALDARQVSRRFVHWSREHHLTVDRELSPLLLYPLDQPTKHRVGQASASNIPLQIPQRVTTLKRTFLVPPWHQFRFNLQTWVDIVLNLLGFVPMGWVFWMILGLRTRLETGPKALIAVAACLVLSLSIESIQMWMPSRSSSLLDLVLNTAGGAVGAGIGYALNLPARLMGKTR